MCGIFGFITDKPSKTNAEMFVDLCKASAIRGHDATGMAIVVDKATVSIDKAPIKASEFITEHIKPKMNLLSTTHLAIGHTRNKTQGSEKDNNNNHPINGKKWIMIHNGTCSSMQRITDYKYKGEVDSEILLSHVEEYGVEKGLSNLAGYAAIAMLCRTNYKELYLWRHNENIYLAYDRDSKTIFFASTDSILEFGVANEFEIFSSFQIRKMPEDIIYVASHSPLTLEGKISIDVKPKYEWKGGYNNYNSYSSYGGHRGQLDTTKSIEHKVKYVWDVTKELLIGVTEKDKENTKDTVPNKYAFSGNSLDFIHWEKVENNGKKIFFSIDKQLIKYWDAEKKCHMLMNAQDAEKENLLTNIIVL